MSGGGYDDDCFGAVCLHWQSDLSICDRWDQLVLVSHFHATSPMIPFAQLCGYTALGFGKTAFLSPLSFDTVQYHTEEMCAMGARHAPHSSHSLPSIQSLKVCLELVRKPLHSSLLRPIIEPFRAYYKDIVTMRYALYSKKACYTFSVIMHYTHLINHVFS